MIGVRVGVLVRVSLSARGGQQRQKGTPESRTPTESGHQGDLGGQDLNAADDVHAGQTRIKY